MKKLSIAVIGCGERAHVYLSELIETMPLYFEVVAGADPVDASIDRIERAARNSNFKRFKSAEQLLKQEKLADICLIATQDNMHYEPCMIAMRKGYDIILEKPIATTIEETMALEAEARRLGRRVMLCFVYRYAPFYSKVKEIIESGALGDIISVNASEGVGQWHQSHSFVRGKWSVAAKSTPMILAKCCHDMDFLSWLIDEPCLSISSFGALTYFNEGNAPEGAPLRCTDGCPVSNSCMYNALRYTSDKRYPWLPQIMPEESSASAEDVTDWLRTSPWGRCVYRCDNDVVDHQVLSAQFAKDITLTFTMTAFANGRSLEIYGTKANLYGGDAFKDKSGHDYVITDHATGFQTKFEMDLGPDAYLNHEGGDQGLVRAFYSEMHSSQPENMRTSITKSIQSHLMSFAAERSRLERRRVEIDELIAEVEAKSAPPVRGLDSL